jgi:quercetin dioxygenase-like cupin family protein
LFFEEHDMPDPLRPAIALAALAASLLLALAASAQPTGIAIQPLLKAPVSDVAGKQTTIALATFAPGATTGRHLHEGDEYATVLEGELELNVEGQAPRRLSAGMAYHNPKGVVHETRNTSGAAARISTVLVIDLGRPLTTPVP